MSFTNPPLKSVPASAALGGSALRQVEAQARANQVMPSKDVMVNRTPNGTFLQLRTPATGGSDAPAAASTQSHFFLKTMADGTNASETGEVIIVAHLLDATAGYASGYTFVAPPPITADQLESVNSSTLTTETYEAVLMTTGGSQTLSGWRYPRHEYLTANGGNWSLSRPYRNNDNFAAILPPATSQNSGIKIKIYPQGTIYNYGSGNLAGYVDTSNEIEATYLDANLTGRTWTRS